MTFEVYVTGDEISLKDWQKLYKALLSYLGILGTFSVIWQCKDNVVRYFIQSNKDIGSLSNAIDGFILRPVPSDIFELPTATGTEHFVQFSAGSNLLDMKEKRLVKKARDLQYATFDVRSLTYENAAVSCKLYFETPGKNWIIANKLMTSLPAQLLAVNFAANTHYLKKTIPRYLNIEKSVHMLTSENVNALFEVDTFPYFAKPYYLNLTSYEFDKHSFIIGASGSGKSKFISLLVDRLRKTSAIAMNYRVIVIDPHASLAEDFEHIQEKKVINFGEESTELFSGTSSDISAATELTGTLLKSLMTNANAKTDRLLRFSLYVLFTAQTMSLGNLKRFLTEIELRNQILDHVKEFVPENIIHFFGTDFNDMRTKYYEETISPIVSLVDEMQMQPALVGEGELSLSQTIENHFLTVFSLNKVSMGEKVVKTVAGLLIQQIFLLAQARVFGQRVILIIDEVSVVQNPALAQILSEARKFNLTVILTQQYFGQIEKNLQDAIFTNVYNYYTFKVSEEDARALEGNLNIELPKEVVEAEAGKRLNEQDLRVKIMTELHPRECLVRVLANGQVAPAIKARTLDAPKSNSSPTAKLKTYKTSKVPVKFDEKTASAAAAAMPELLSSPNPLDMKPLTDDLATNVPPADNSFDSLNNLANDDYITAPNFSKRSPESGPEMPSFNLEPTPEDEEPRPDPYELHPEDRPSAKKAHVASKIGKLVSQNAKETEIAPGQTYKPGVILQSLEPQTFNLSDLLAAHSSSRAKVNHRKDN